MKTLTISIAAYNIEPFIKETIDSLLDQRIEKDIEIIIVNDGSSDKTLEIANQYARKYPDTIKVVDKENGGYGSTINTSLPLAKGKYYKLLDGDDWYHMDNLVKVISILKQANEDMIITPHITVIDETGEQTIERPLGSEWEEKTINFKEYPTGKRVCMHQACFRTEVIQNKGIQITEHCFYTDVEYLLKCMAECKTLRYLDIPLYMYRVGLEEQSMSVEGMKKHYQDAVKSYLELLDFRKKNNIDKEYIDNYMNDALISLGKYYMNMFFFLPISKRREYKLFEKNIKEKAPDIYEFIETRKIKAVRKSQGLLYIPACWWGRFKVRKAIRV